MADQPAPPAQSQRVAAAPMPVLVEHPPLPKRKPPTPSSQPLSTSAPDPAAVPEPAAPAETRLATLEPAPSTSQAPSTVPNDIIGMESSVIEQSLGPPESRRDVPPAVVWQYADDSCGLDIWLYRDLQSGALRALFVEVKGDDRTDQRRQFCIKQLALQSTAGAHHPGADEAAPR